MSELNKQQKKEYAKILFTLQQLTQKETADKVGVSQKTMSAWAKEGNWDSLKASLIISKEQQLRRIYAQINELNNFIEKKEFGERFASSSEGDTLSKLASTARALETEMSLSDTISAFMAFLDWLRTIDPMKAKEIILLQDQFIQFKLSR